MSNTTLARALLIGNNLADEHAKLIPLADPLDQRLHRTLIRQINHALAWLSAGNTPRPVTDGVWLVPSSTGADRYHRVDTNTDTCDCERGIRNQTCWAAIAVFLWVEGLNNAN